MVKQGRRERGRERRDERNTKKEETEMQVRIKG